MDSGLARQLDQTRQLRAAESIFEPPVHESRVRPTRDLFSKYLRNFNSKPASSFFAAAIALETVSNPFNRSAASTSTNAHGVGQYRRARPSADLAREIFANWGASLSWPRVLRRPWLRNHRPGRNRVLAPPRESIGSFQPASKGSA